MYTTKLLYDVTDATFLYILIFLIDLKFYLNILNYAAGPRL